ncbi:MAG: hypothetical protein RBG13Loki_2668 [Promethearchaeota archaeon CR_4]|nr:MAG: hypothetical protein RBG13Loki_2668 [Candidatus Lokiarchaeota archaeon CR_4]
MSETRLILLLLSFWFFLSPVYSFEVEKKSLTSKMQVLKNILESYWPNLRCYAAVVGPLSIPHRAVRYVAPHWPSVANDAPLRGYATLGQGRLSSPSRSRAGSRLSFLTFLF